ncbi:MAG: nitrogen fixation protein FixA [Alphaproteobacteria bacterium]|jgi:electron transfer flavoprotein beta subunit|nr:nitrogen fixation protein FixA [Alphaproteobacteria bacterium]
MHSVVCIKQVPDSAQIRVHPVTNTIMRQGVPTIINPYDLYAVEEALRVKDKVGGKVTVISMGPPMAEQALRKALSFGADRAILVTDRAFAGSDTLATSYVLASAIAKVAAEEPVDIVFCGKQTIDGDTAQVGPGIARRLDIQQLTYVAKLERLDLDKREIAVQRRAEGGVQVLSTKLPCMITMLEGSNEIRFATMDDMFRAARANVEVWGADTSGVEDKTQCGLKGSPTVVKKVFAPKPREEKAEMIESRDKAPAEIAASTIEVLAAADPALAAEFGPRPPAGA